VTIQTVTLFAQFVKARRRVCWFASPYKKARCHRGHIPAKPVGPASARSAHPEDGDEFACLAGVLLDLVMVDVERKEEALVGKKL